MKSKSLRLLSALLSFALVFGLFAATPPTADAMGEPFRLAPETPIQGNVGTIAELATYINNFNPGNNSSGKLTASVNGSTITVTGTVNNATNALPFTLKYNWSMVWKATYKGKTSEDYLIQVVSEADSNGKHREFRMEGTIESTGCGTIGSKFATIRIHNGTVRANGAEYAIGVYDGEVVITGDLSKVSSQYLNAIYVYQGRGVTISGGQVYSESGTAINTFLTTITVNGGFVYSTPWHLYPGIYSAISATNDGDITVSGSGVVCVWDDRLGTREYVDGSSTDLWVMPADGATWTSGGIAYDNGTLFPLSGITTYQAVTVTFNSNGGSEVEPVMLKANTKLPKPSNPTRDAYRFLGWYRDSALTQEFNFDSTPIQHDMTLYAKWVSNIIISEQLIIDPTIFRFLLDQRTITFESNGGSAIANQTIAKGNTVEKPADPVRLLADFSGWYTNEALTQAYDFATLVEEDFTLYAKWATKKVVTFESNGGSAVTFESNGEIFPYQIVFTGSPAIAPANPTLSGFAFAGWYKDVTDSAKYDFYAPVTDHLTLYAKWTPIDAGSRDPGSGDASMSNFVSTGTYTPGMFNDVNEADPNAWYVGSVAIAYQYGLMQGNGNTFNPTGYMTLAEAITLAARVHSIYETGSGDFVQGTVWYQVYVNYAMANGIITANDFTDYDRAATRAEMAYIFSRCLPDSEFPAQNTVNFLPDANSATPYYSAIYMLYQAGILSGNDSEGTFNPGNNIIRAEVAAIISRVILPSTRLSGRVYGWVV